MSSVPAGPTSPIAVAHQVSASPGLASRTLVMGILNLTPDSFSDGGQHQQVDAAVAHAEQMVLQGANIIDLGGESTRPGAEPVIPELEQQRVLPVLEALLKRQLHGNVPAGQSQQPNAVPEDSGAQPIDFSTVDFNTVWFSVDTLHADTAEAALKLAGERASELIINDVSGLMTEERMPAVVSFYGCDVVITHNRGDSKTMQQKTDYDAAQVPTLLAGLDSAGVVVAGLENAPSVVVTVLAELLQLRQRYVDAGVRPEQIILDPGIGFAKTHEQNWELIRHLHLFTQLQVQGHQHRVLFGASRKGFLGALLADAQGNPRPADQRETATAALSQHAAAAGCWAVRVHDPVPTADALAVLAQLGNTGAQPRA